MTERSAADEEIMRLATEDAAETPAEEPLELGTEETPEAKPEDVEADKEEKKTRSHSLTNRVHTLTARLRAAEQEAADLRARSAPAPVDTDPAPDPNDEKYDFGEADPKFIRDYASHAAREAIREERAKLAETDKATDAQNATVSVVKEGLAKVEADLAEKYPDFEESIAKAIEAREGVPLPAVTTIAISQSPVGADVLNRLATDTEAMQRIDTAVDAAMKQIEAIRAQGHEPGPSVLSGAALEFGKLEGEYLDDDSDSDLDPSDPLDMARMMGRMKSRLAGKRAGTVERKTTKAPVPPENRARGGNGQFEVSDDTEDFAAFERKIMGGRR
jgi:hypothetical protein